MKRLSLLIPLFALTNCAGPDSLGKLNLKAWRNDRGACKGERTQLANDFMAVRDQLKGIHANDLGKMLGRPDINQILERNQKLYVYYVEKGPQCNGNPGAKSNAKSVALRVSAIGLITEVTIQNGIP
jgi:hypothetical protein